MLQQDRTWICGVHQDCASKSFLSLLLLLLLISFITTKNRTTVGQCVVILLLSFSLSSISIHSNDHCCCCCCCSIDRFNREHRDSQKLQLLLRLKTSERQGCKPSADVTVVIWWTENWKLKKLKMQNYNAQRLVWGLVRCGLFSGS